MWENLKVWFVNKYAASVVRHLLSFLAGLSPYLMSINIDPELVSRFLSDAQEVLYSVAMFAIALLWSFFQKKKN